VGDGAQALRSPATVNPAPGELPGRGDDEHIGQELLALAQPAGIRSDHGGAGQLYLGALLCVEEPGTGGGGVGHGYGPRVPHL